MPSNNSLLARYSHLGTSVEFLQRFAPSIEKDEALTSNPIAAYEANRNRIPTIGQAAQLPTIGRRTTVNWLVIQFNHTAKQFGSKDTLTHQQLIQAAVDFLDLNHDLNPYEVMLYLRLLRAGKYGKVAYGQLTPNDIMAHTTTFRNQRDEQLSQHYRQEQEAQEQKQAQRAAKHAISYEAFVELKKRAENGDIAVQQLLATPAP